MYNMGEMDIILFKWPHEAWARGMENKLYVMCSKFDAISSLHAGHVALFMFIGSIFVFHMFPHRFYELYFSPQFISFHLNDETET